MKTYRFLFLAARLCFGIFIFVTSIYCLLAYIPFTFYWFIKYPLLPWLPVLVNFHPTLSFLVVAAACATLIADLRNRRTKLLAIAFFVFQAIFAAIYFRYALLSKLPNDYRSFLLSLFVIVSMLWIALIDFVACSGERAEQSKRVAEEISPMPALYSALLISFLYATLSMIHQASRGELVLGKSEMVAIGISAVSHLGIFSLVFLLLEIAFRLLRIIYPSRARFLAFRVVGFAVGAVVIRKLVLAPLSFYSWWAGAYSIVLSLCVVMFIAGLIERWGLMDERNEAESQQRTAHWGWKYLWLGSLGAIAYFAPNMIGAMDWNLLLQRLFTVVLWLAIFILFYRSYSPGASSHRRYQIAGVALLAVISFGGYQFANASGTSVPSWLISKDLDVESAVEQYAGGDLSFKVARDILTPSMYDSSYQAFYQFLQQNSELPDSVRAEPVDIKLVEDFKPSTAKKKPNIFIFVVDSLRRDYLSTYNKSVTFTPSLDAFARESVVMENAFTRYSGTVLSEPAIWTGTLQLHKQYITPFYPMNSLQKLVDADGYDKWVTMDPVVKIILREDPSIVELDKERGRWVNLDLSATVKELESRLDRRTPESKPVFMYTQSQNLHPVRLMRTRMGTKVTYQKSYPGFDPLYASELERIDQGFGEFIQYLKSHNLYDDSIVVVTSDHGDSLGEFGRWGHVQNMFPEVIRIPLIIHLPSKLQKGMYSDPKAISFSMDVTPSLFYLLGYRPIVNDELFGRPLFTATKEEHDSYLRDSYLLVSSYGAVYATLRDRGKSLFIVDAVAYKNYFYDLSRDPRTMHNRLTREVIADNEAFIRHSVNALNKFYKLPHDEFVAAKQ